MWFSRYRTMDGYNIYGGRSELKYNDVTNYKVMQDEMSVRDVMTANRDKRVWAVAQGGEMKVDDSNAPPVTSVPTNKPGKGPNGEHEFLSGSSCPAKMTVPAHCRNLFASEEQFRTRQSRRDGVDTRAVSGWRRGPNYPERTPWSKKGDALLVFEDTWRWKA